MDNEIKQGDKVRVSKDAPKIYTPDWVDEMFNLVLKVTKVEDGNAMVVFAERTPYKTVLTTIPCKYLVKVDAEAKEPKFEVGDVVRIKPTADKLHQGYQNGYAWLPERDEYLGRVASVKEIWCDGSIILSIRNNMLWEPIDLEPYTEPKEQTEAKYTKTKGDTLTFPITFDLSDSYWDAYTADLAKEIAVKVANKHSDPTEAAEYAVQVAKAVVENLKRK